MLKRLLGAENGWGGATGTLLLIGFGIFVLFVSIADLREAARLEPVKRTCTDWLKDPSGPRWVSLSGCRLELAEAASRKWKGWRSLRDGGVSGAKYLELFLPISASGVPSQPPRAVLATTDKELLSLVDGMDQVPPEEAVAYVEAHGGAFRALLEPEVLSGYVEPVRSLAARSALDFISDEDAVVLEQGREPARGNALFGLVVGLLCIAVAVRSMALRMMVDRDTTQ